MMFQTFSYYTVCTSCQGEGTTEEACPSMGGVGGTVLVERPCYACKGSGQGELVEATYCDVCDREDCPGCDWEPAAAPVIWNGGTVDAPGFSTETFITSLERAEARGYFHIAPAGNGAVLVTTESGTTYTVTRQSCSCKGHMGHGHCQHRAAAIACADLWGLNLCETEIVGFDQTTRPMVAVDLREVA